MSPSKPHTTAAKTKNARKHVRRSGMSVFRASALVVLLSILVVSVSFATLSLINTRASVQENLRDRAIEVTQLLAMQSGGALRFGRAEALKEPIESVFAASRGQAVAGLGYSLSEGPLAETGSVDSALQALARSAAETGTPAFSTDAYSVAIPSFAGDAVAGAVAMRWSPERQLATVWSDMARSGLFIGVIGAIATLIGTLTLRWYVARPLVQLSGAMNRIARADYTVHIPDLRRSDEIGAIGRALIEMRDALADGAQERHVSAFRSAALEASSAPMMMLDNSLKILHLNTSIQSLLEELAPAIRETRPGFDPQDVVGHELSFLDDPRQELDELLLDATKLPCTVDMKIGDVRLQLRIGVVRDASGAPIGRVVEFDNVSEATLNRAIIGSIDAAQVFAEFRIDGVLTNANAHVARTCGVATAEDLVGLSVGEIFDLDAGRAGGEAAFLAGMTSGEPVVAKFAVRGSDAVVDGSIFAVLDARGVPMRYVLIGQDVTASERDIAEADARRKSLEAQQSKVVEALSVALNRVSGGDLTTRIETEFAADYEGLRRDFNLAVETLRGVLSDVTDMAENVRKETVEISGSADSLSQRTEKTAATLEETAAALDELTSSVHSAAEGAEQANTVVSSARGHATQSGAVVHEAVTAMSEIEESSSKIAKIIDVIEDIAFQTNLLALNAGVEAARAGEAGRGFAVVASEVRALAQRSSDAAQEINSLITSSGVQVQRGVALVDKAGKALEQIVSSVGEISDLVGGIAVSAKEQSTGVSEINTAVNQLDQATQHNAAMFEETTAASHALTALAESLNKTVSRFDTGRRSQAGTHSGPSSEDSRESVSAATPPPFRENTVNEWAPNPTPGKPEQLVEVAAAVGDSAPVTAPPVSADAAEEAGWEEF